jgi:hypothetical protein
VNIAFIAPLQRAWGRMERMLFRPFRLETWLVMGFAAFLSEYLSGKSFGSSYRWHRGHGGIHSEFAHRVAEFFSNPAMLVLAITAGLIVLVIVIVLLWVSCRGRFIFLDNVVHERPAIVDPWSRYARQGNSLFLWSMAFLLVCAVALMVVALPFLASLRALWGDGEFHWLGLLSLAGFMFMAIPVALAIAYTILFLNHFVVPIMFRESLSATAAWGRFLTLLRAHPGSFIAYGLLMIVLWIAIGIAIAFVGLSTCCIGFILFATPYLGQVVLLPVHVTLRAFGPEFLAQFGPEFDLFGAAPAPPASPQPPPLPSAS